MGKDKDAEGNKKRPSKLKLAIIAFMYQFEQFFGIGIGQQEFLGSQISSHQVVTPPRKRESKPLPKLKSRPIQERLPVDHYTDQRCKQLLDSLR